MADITNLDKGRSPFSPGRPVPLEMFVGRAAQIARMLRSAQQAAFGRQENLFVTGEYGIGKSSLISYIRTRAERQYKLAGFHVLLGGVATVEDMVQHVVSRVIQQAHRGGVLDQVRSFLGKYVESVELFNVRLNLGAMESDAPAIAQDFLPFLRRLWASLRGNCSGLALYLDDLNGVAREPRFAAMVKSLVDEIAVSGQELPLLLALSGIPQRRQEILANQPSVERIFDIVELGQLDDAEVETFYREAFGSANVTIEEAAMRLLVEYSGGLPKIMHELGDAAFWEDSDNRIDRADAQEGLLAAADNVGRKYFEPVRQALRSEDYQSILRKLGAVRTADRFRKSDLESGLSEPERRKLSNFLQRMKKLHALLPGGARGEYTFPNRLIRIYLFMQSGRAGGE